MPPSRGIPRAWGRRFLGERKAAVLLGKSKLYSKLLAPRNVDAGQLVSQRLLPDEAILALDAGLLTIIEKKWQQRSGSVDEKLQTCHFKKRQYEKLLAPLGLRVQFVYVLNDWFRAPRYRDVLDYVREVGCDYCFQVLPWERLGLPPSTSPC